MPQEYDPPRPLFDTIAARTGLDRLLSAVPGVSSPLVGWAVFWVGVVVLFQGYKYAAGYSGTWVDNPVSGLGSVMLVLAAVAVEYIYDRYETALEQIDVAGRTSTPGWFSTILPAKWQTSIYVVAVLYTFLTFFVLKGVETLTQIGGVAEVVFAAVVAPVGFATVTAEFVGAYVGVMFLLPRRIRKSDFKLHFLDPEGLGGLRPIGELMKSAYYFLVLGLIGWLLIVYGPVLMGQFVESPLPQPGFVIDVAFTGAWLLSIATMAYGLSQLHWYMKREKRKELTRLDRQAREHVENPYDLDEYTVTDEERFDDLRTRMNHVKRTKEFPTTFTMWSQILVSLILPKAVQMLLASI